MILRRNYRLIAVLLFLVTLTNVLYNISNIQNHQRERSVKKRSTSSIFLEAVVNRMGLKKATVVEIYTFFDDLDNVLGKEAPGKKTFKSDREILQAWKEAWSSMGYTPKVLTMEDAKRHPHYQMYSNSLDKLAPTLLGRNVAYDKACYLRWLAMATSGGLFLSDFDTVPLTPPDLPNDLVPPEKFTLFQSSIPSLLKGTSEQWTMMANLLLDEALNYSNSTKEKKGGQEVVLYSDMMALDDLIQNESTQNLIQLFQNDNQNPQQQSVANGKRILQKERQFSEEDCSILAQQRAVHFHHGCESISNGLVDELLEDTMPYQSRRSIFMTKWLPYFKKYICP